jgi:hypothetical protein
VLSNFLIRGTDNTDTSKVTRGISSVDGVKLYNGIIYAIGGGGSPNGSSGLQVHVGGTFYNLTVICNGGITAINLDDGTFKLRNVYAGGSVWFTAINDESTTDMAYCATSDTSAFGTGSIDNVPVSTANFSNVTATTEDWRLVSGSVLRSAGTDLSGDSALPVTVGIRSNARDSVPDIGADEYSP